MNRGTGAALQLLTCSALCVGCGGQDLFVSAVLEQDEDCEYAPQADRAESHAQYDIAAGATPDSEACDDPFVAHLLVHNDNEAEALVEAAEVRLTTLARHTIVFDREQVPLPNPFLITLASPVPSGKGIVPLQVIPIEYGRQLEHFVDTQLLVEVELQATTGNGDDLGSNAFRFPVEICDGCRTLCASDPRADDAACSEPELGPERAVCIDESC